jgi:inner membrane protein
VATALAETEVSIEGIAITAFGALLPDIDTPSSSIGRPFFPLAGWVNRKVGHRTASHSVLGVLGLASCVLGSVWLFSWLSGLDFWAQSFEQVRTEVSLEPRRPGTWDLRPSTWFHYSWLLILGYASHILVDTFNKTGVELFWPARVRSVFFLNERYRINSGGSGDYWFMTVCLILSLGMYPLARDGFTLSVHRFFGDIYSVVMDYRAYGDKHRIWLNLEGVEAISNQKITGRFEILATTDNAAVLIERKGLKQVVSRTPPLQIYPEKVSIEIGETIQITTQEIDMMGRTLGEIPRFQSPHRVLLYGHLTPARFANLSIHQDQFNPLSRSLDKIKLEHAEYKDILAQDLQNVLIREGKLVAKICSTPSDGNTSAIQFVPTHITERIRLVELRIALFLRWVMSLQLAR